MTEIQHLPLAGVRILDLTRVLAGPLCTMTLGDLGADVIKVERPGTGDETRGWGPPFDPRGEAAYFLSINRNKLSLAADFSDPDDQELLLSLMAEADVVVDNFLPGMLARYRLDPESMLLRFPKLVWCTISGFGADSRRPGYDFVVQAEAGWMGITGPAQGPPMKIGVALADVITGKDAATAILAALAARDAGRPHARHIRVSLVHSATAALVNVAQNVLVSGADARRWGNAHPNLVPYQLFEASDRPFVVAVGTDRQWSALAGALELDLAGDDQLRTNAGRVRERERVVEAIAKRVAVAPAADWMKKLAQAGVPCGLVRTIQEALQAVDADAVLGIAPATGGQVRRQPPSLDEHGRLIRQNHWSVFTMLPILES